MYLNERDANMRLQGTIIRKGGVPIYIEGFMGSNAFHYRDSLREGEVKQARLSDDDVSILPVPLGYVNHEQRAIYLQRMPLRRYKQGLDRGCLSSPSSVRDFSSIIRSRVFVDMVYGLYPTVSECANAIMERRCTSLAFNKEWALKKGESRPFLMYKGRAAGHFDEGGVILKPSRSYLQESLDEALAYG